MSSSDETLSVREIVEYSYGPGMPFFIPEKSDGSSTDYYKIPTNATDLIDLIEYKNMNFAVGNIFKACYRLGQKDGNDDAYDIRKIIFFAERELKRLEQNG